jgi:mRNA-degrading endonuclease YafQ of YafQ-DinJ toxin-antitoxin module
MVMRLKLGKISSASILKIKEGSSFRQDVQRMKKRGKSLNGLKKAIELLANGKTLQRSRLSQRMVGLP